MARTWGAGRGASRRAAPRGRRCPSLAARLRAVRTLCHDLPLNSRPRQVDDRLLGDEHVAPTSAAAPVGDLLGDGEEADLEPVRLLVVDEACRAPRARRGVGRRPGRRGRWRRPGAPGRRRSRRAAPALSRWMNQWLSGHVPIHDIVVPPCFLSRLIAVPRSPAPVARSARRCQWVGGRLPHEPNGRRQPAEPTVGHIPGATSGMKESAAMTIQTRHR